jgi:hypothetical protein
MKSLSHMTQAAFIIPRMRLQRHYYITCVTGTKGTIVV